MVAKVIDLEHAGVDILSKLGQQPFEIGEEGRVIEGPFRSILSNAISFTFSMQVMLYTYLKVPLVDGEGMGNSQPIPMHLEVRRSTAQWCQLLLPRV